MTTVVHSELGKKTAYPDHYDPSLLFPIARQGNRDKINLQADLPFHGIDIWNAYEISWLNEKGKPEVRVAEFILPCTSPFLIESKSFKLYLNSFNNTRLPSEIELLEKLHTDLSAAAGAAVKVKLMSVEDSVLNLSRLQGTCIDDLDIDITDYQPNAQLLVTNEQEKTETLVSHLLKSNCPVTNQPDWATVQITYSGLQIQHESLLKYIISFRDHNEFHEQCVERMFVDIMQRCQPRQLSVYARYTRRGGLDINPFRSNFADYPDNQRTIRQ